MKRTLVILSFFASLLCAQPKQADIVIYGATSSGIAAAVQASRMGKSVLIIDPGTHIGGLTTGGLGWTDIGNKQVVGGIAREFYRRIKTKYDDPKAWKWETHAEYMKLRRGENNPGEDAMWTFEPHVATQVYGEMLAQYKIPVVLNTRLDLRPGKGVRMNGQRITAIVTDQGAVYSGRMFIDATYEGDLMARSGVSYTIGREANAEFGENYNGVEAEHRHSHQFPDGLKISPFVRPGDPSSGLLPGIDPKGPGVRGEGDKRIQVYCFRLCMSRAEGNRVAIEKPEGYHARDYELLLRYAESGQYHVPSSKWDPLPNLKTDTNNHGAVSTDFIGMNYDYPEGDYETRANIIKQHETYTKGYLWTLQNSPRVPEAIRAYYRQWGFPKDEFLDNGHFPTQLYIRESRRMKSGVVMTEHYVTGRELAKDSVGMGAYGMDSHNVQRYITGDAQTGPAQLDVPAGTRKSPSAPGSVVWANSPNSYVRNEGNIQVGGFSPYPISYQSIVPKKGQATNLFVPVCLSATHIAYGSIRMEPVFMVLGQSAATAASMAIDAKIDVQSVDYALLQKRLLADNQILQSPPTLAKIPGRLDPRKLGGIVIDDNQAERKGPWTHSGANHPYMGDGYSHDGNARDGKASITFKTDVPAPGMYRVKVLYPINENRASNALVTVTCDDGTHEFRINEKKEAVFLAPCKVSKSITVTVGNKDTDGYVVVDGVQIVESK